MQASEETEARGPVANAAKGVDVVAEQRTYFQIEEDEEAKRVRQAAFKLQLQSSATRHGQVSAFAPAPAAPPSADVDFPPSAALPTSGTGTKLIWKNDRKSYGGA